MIATRYKQLSKELQECCKDIPLRWGKIQNDVTDSKLNLFRIANYEHLESTITGFSKEDKNYFRRRWFLWQCSKVDEYLFYSQNNIRRNPNRKDKNWDVEFFNNSSLRFDIKSTITPKKFRKNFTFADEKKIIKFYYNNQSLGVRNHLQNRLFVVHHSFYAPERSLFLRCHWALKEKAYQHFSKLLNNNLNCIPYRNVIAKCIFIFENRDQTYSYKIV